LGPKKPMLGGRCHSASFGRTVLISVRKARWEGTPPADWLTFARAAICPTRPAAIRIRACASGPPTPFLTRGSFWSMPRYATDLDNFGRRLRRVSHLCNGVACRTPANFDIALHTGGRFLARSRGPSARQLERRDPSVFQEQRRREPVLAAARPARCQAKQANPCAFRVATTPASGSRHQPANARASAVGC